MRSEHASVSSILAMDGASRLLRFGTPYPFFVSALAVSRKAPRSTQGSREAKGSRIHGCQVGRGVCACGVYAWHADEQIYMYTTNGNTTNAYYYYYSTYSVRVCVYTYVYKLLHMLNVLGVCQGLYGCSAR